MHPTPSLFVRTVAGAIVTAFLTTSLPLNALAGVITTDVALQASVAAATRTDQLSRVQAALARQEVQSRLTSLGVDTGDAMQRAAALNDADLARLSSQLDQLPAGGDAGILALIGAVFIVLLVLDYLDVVHVFHRRH